MRFPSCRSFLLPVALLALSGQAVAAQRLSTPPDWKWRLDRPARLVTEQAVPDSSWRFVAMPPGWHVTTGPGVVLHHPDARATGRYSLATDLVAFPRPSDAPFGLVLGGADLGAPGAPHLAVQLRRDGALRVMAMRDGRQDVLAPWTVHPAIRPHPGPGVITNRLRVAVAPDSLRVFVNDSAVVAVPAMGVVTDGQFGLQIGERLDFHITTLDHVRHLAPRPAPSAPAGMPK